MIEKFDLTSLICMGGNMGPATFEEAQRLKWLINENPKNLENRFKQARFFVSTNDDIHVIISYCKIIKFFDNNLTAYTELAEYLYNISSYEWAMIVSTEGLKHHKSAKLEQILNESTKGFINLYQNDVSW